MGFNPHQRYLAVGTKEGKVGLFKFVGFKPPSSSANRPGSPTRGQGGQASTGFASSGGHGNQEEASTGGATDWEAMTPTAVA